MFKYALAIICVCSTAFGSEADPPHNDYSDPATWLCRPGKTGACTESQDATVDKADGTVSQEPFRPNLDAKVDCFYLYPTSSEDVTPNSDMIPGREADATMRQFGRFGLQCRQFAPLYRSITLRALRARLFGIDVPGLNSELPYRDVVDAWNYYLSHDNQGRGVVLIGHSQGATLLIKLLQEQIEGRPVQHQIISAIVPGHTVLVPAGKTVGGTFKSMPLCTRRDEIGCIVAYSTYRDTIPPSTDPPARFGHAENGMLAACTNPAALGSDEPVELDTYMSRGVTQWTHNGAIETPFVRVPGLVKGGCVTRGEFRYLEIHVVANPEDPRTDTIPGDIIVNGRPDALWGLHPADISLVMGNLLNLVDSQSTAWLKANAHGSAASRKMK
jgi:hypothetical protein